MKKTEGYLYFEKNYNKPTEEAQDMKFTYLDMKCANEKGADAGAYSGLIIGFFMGLIGGGIAAISLFLITKP